MKPVQEKQKITHDIRGQICPSALLTSLKEINANKEQIQKGMQAIEILTDNREATATIPNAAQKMGYRVAVNKTGEYYTIIIDTAVL